MRDDMNERVDADIERIAAALRPLPPVDAAARARVLVAVQADQARVASASARRRTTRRAAAAGSLAALAAAGIVAALLLVRPDARPTGGVARVVQGGAAPEAQPIPDGRGASVTPAGNPGGVASVAVPLVVSAPHAARVSVVGDFTGWDQHRIEMTRDPVSGLWVTLVSVRPGRHVYAFVADDSLWLLDPRAPVASDPDFGRPGSLMLVGRP
jgi:hypothetical protein